jgi:hypothetical protein
MTRTAVLGRSPEGRETEGGGWDQAFERALTAEKGGQVNVHQEKYQECDDCRPPWTKYL